ncbi:MAG: 30S ribosome-binding factor RbfA [Verrucomicrobiae bacterium]|nr:30S ribosome-binding factor RbfA [Verrucomicrobiae bacterium]
MESNNRRLARVRELLKQEIARILREELDLNDVGLLTVNAVGVGRDLRSAVVFLGFVGTPAQRRRAPEVLAEQGGLIRSRVGANVRLKFTPEIRFQLDDSIEQGNRVLALLDALEREAPSPSPAPPTGS